MIRPRPLLSICAGQQASAYVIRIEGRLDQGGWPDLEAALAEAERAGTERIVLDLDQLASIDANGLETLAAVSRRSAANGDRLRLTRGSGEVAWLLRLTLPPQTERQPVAEQA
jgi:anti-anti-sigma factor